MIQLLLHKYKILVCKLLIGRMEVFCPGWIELQYKMKPEEQEGEQVTQHKVWDVVSLL